MIYRKFQDVQLSGLGLGMMRLPVQNGDDSTVDEAAAAEMIPPPITPPTTDFWSTC